MKILFWPVIALWEFLTFVLKATGRLITAVFGLVLMITGIFLTVTVVAAPLGIPLIVFGFLLMIRSIF